MTERVKVVEVYKQESRPSWHQRRSAPERLRGNHTLLLIVRGARLGPVVFTMVGNSGRAGPVWQLEAEGQTLTYIRLGCTTAALYTGKSP